jgi:hypothetical protein
MKKYKTWEAIKMLVENPKLKFKNTVEINGINLIGVNGLVICWFTDDGAPISRFTPKLNELDWELIQEPVDFLTAVKAYSEGKTIRCEYNGEVTKYENGKNCMYRLMVINHKNASTRTVEANEILYGTWYVEE